MNPCEAASHPRAKGEGWICVRPIYVKGEALCQSHYMQLRRTGEVVPLQPPRTADSKTFTRSYVLPEKDYQALVELAKTRGVGVNDLVREAVRGFLIAEAMKAATGK
jgi:hypothetical protein